MSTYTLHNQTKRTALKSLPEVMNRARLKSETRGYITIYVWAVGTDSDGIFYVSSQYAHLTFADMQSQLSPTTRAAKSINGFWIVASVAAVKPFVVRES